MGVEHSSYTFPCMQCQALNIQIYKLYDAEATGNKKHETAQQKAKSYHVYVYNFLPKYLMIP